MTFALGPSAPPAPPPPPPPPPQLSSAPIKASSEAARAAAAAAAGAGFNDTIGASGVAGAKTPNTTGGKSLLGQ